jgi:capsular polysaccharide export protein
VGLHPDLFDLLTRAEALAPAQATLAKLRLPRERHFLFVTAPFGAFSRALAARLRREGARCSRVLLNGGDVLDWGLSHAHAYFGPLDGWTDWLAETVRRERVTDLILYGDCNPYCAAAKQVAARLELLTHIFEQGYFRPFWITLERDGVNANSRLQRDPERCRTPETACAAPVEPVWLAPLTPPAVRRIFAYHVALGLLHPAFSRYRPPYVYSAHRQMAGHVRRYLAQRLRRRRARRVLAQALAQPGPIFVVLLQRPGDSQLMRHSPFRSTVDFIRRVVESFAAFAPSEARLIFKAHPLDPGLEPHAGTIAQAAADAGLGMGVGGRVRFVDDGDLNALLARVEGVVTINSTSGLTALEHGRPTVVLGKSIYDLPGLTHRRGLDVFWTSPDPPDAERFAAFRRFEMASTQINGAYATRRGVDLAVPEAARRMLAR